ncbi:MAG: hypothetical protein J6U54_01575 [Clostridiales bacterium]|nr:hypothetical protein [Clostridiales bacterium]
MAGIIGKAWSNEEKFYDVVTIGHVYDDNVTTLHNARIVRRDFVEYRPEGQVKEFEVEFESGRRSEFYGLWGSESDNE